MYWLSNSLLLHFVFSAVIKKLHFVKFGFEVVLEQPCLLRNNFQHLTQGNKKCCTAGSPFTCTRIIWSVKEKLIKLYICFQDTWKILDNIPVIYTKVCPFLHDIRLVTHLVNNIFFRDRRWHNAGRQTICFWQRKYWNPELFGKELSWPECCMVSCQNW